METTGQSLRAESKFTPRTLGRAEWETARIADRWAPEGRAALRTPALRALSFVDHLLAPQRTFADAPASSRATRSAELMAGGGGRGGASWWMFPVPWYVDQQRPENDPAHCSHLPISWIRPATWTVRTRRFAHG